MNGMTPAKKLATTLGATAALTMLLAGGAMAAEDHLGNTDCGFQPQQTMRGSTHLEQTLA